MDNDEDVFLQFLEEWKAKNFPLVIALDTLATCHNCGAVGTIAQRCDRCGRII